MAYKEGQYFKAHHDAGVLLSDDEVDEESGCEGGRIELGDPRRLVTFFVYLNTLPKGQGATAFPRLGIEVSAVRALASWASIVE